MLISEELGRSNDLRDKLSVAGRVDLTQVISMIREPQHWGDKEGNMAITVAVALGIKLFCQPTESDLVSTNFDTASFLLSEHAYALIWADRLTQEALKSLPGWLCRLYQVVTLEGSYSLPDWEILTKAGRGRPSLKSPQRATGESALEALRALAGNVRTSAAGVEELVVQRCFCGAKFTQKVNRTYRVAEHVREKHPTVDMASLIALGREQGQFDACHCGQLCLMNANGKLRQHKCSTDAPSSPPQRAGTSTSANTSEQPQATEIYDEGLVQFRSFAPMIDSQLDAIEAALNEQGLNKKDQEAKAKILLVSFLRGHPRDPADERQVPAPMDDRAKRESIANLLQLGRNTEAHKRYESLGLVSVTRKQLRSKMPLEVDADEHFTPITFDEFAKVEVEHVQAFCSSRTNVHALGPEGVPFSHWVKYAETPERALKLARVINAIARRPILTEESLRLMTRVRSVTLGKDDGGFRPIGIATGFERIRQGVAAAKCLGPIAATLHPHNLTLARDGTTTIIHTAQVALENGAFLRSVDLINAFNQQAVKPVTESLDARHLSASAYQARLLAQLDVVHCEGLLTSKHIPQGSSFGSALMAVASDDILREVRENAANGIILTLADDTSVIATTSEGRDHISDTVEKAFIEAGHRENRAKRLDLSGSEQNSGRILGAFFGPEAHRIGRRDVCPNPSRAGLHD